MGCKRRETDTSTIKTRTILMMKSNHLIGSEVLKLGVGQSFGENRPIVGVI